MDDDINKFGFKNKLIHPDEAQSKAHLVIEKTYADIYKNYHKKITKFHF